MELQRKELNIRIMRERGWRMGTKYEGFGYLILSCNLGNSAILAGRISETVFDK